MFVHTAVKGKERWRILQRESHWQVKSEILAQHFPHPYLGG